MILEYRRHSYCTVIELQLKYILDRNKTGIWIIGLGANLGYYHFLEYQKLNVIEKIYALSHRQILKLLGKHCPQ